MDECWRPRTCWLAGKKMGKAASVIHNAAPVRQSVLVWVDVLAIVVGASAVRPAANLKPLGFATDYSNLQREYLTLIPGTSSNSREMLLSSMIVTLNFMF